MADRGRRLTCPECGHETTLPETALEGEVDSREHAGGSAWGHDEGPWEGENRQANATLSSLHTARRGLGWTA